MESGTLRRSDTPEGKKIWDMVERVAYRAPLCQMGRSGRCTCYLCSARRAALAWKAVAKRYRDDT